MRRETGKWVRDTLDKNQYSYFVTEHIQLKVLQKYFDTIPVYEMYIGAFYVEVVRDFETAKTRIVEIFKGEIADFMRINEP